VTTLTQPWGGGGRGGLNLTPQYPLGSAAANHPSHESRKAAVVACGNTRVRSLNVVPVLWKVTKSHAGAALFAAVSV
jgi:hypothetical protein